VNGWTSRTSTGGWRWCAPGPPPDRLGLEASRLQHGDGDATWVLLSDAIRRGIATRIGLEDTLYEPAVSEESRECGAGGCQPGAADGQHQGDPAAAQQQQRGERLLTPMVGQGSHGQLVWQ
jgi:hypothetical protein